MDIFKMLSDIAAVIKKPSGNTSADKKSEKSAVFPVVSDNPKPDTEVQNNELRLTFKEAQQAGFQFCYTRKSRLSLQVFTLSPKRQSFQHILTTTLL